MMHHDVGGKVEQLGRPIATVVVAIVVAVGLRRNLRPRRSLGE
jgi:hypothetical protein